MLLTLRRRMILFCVCAVLAFVYLFTLQVHASKVGDDGYTYYKIKVKQNIEAGGTTSNDKWVKEGESVKIHAYPASGYEFKGWYKSGKHKSDDTDYKVKDVHEDRTYIAMFEKKEPPAPTTVMINVTVVPANAGIVTGNGEYTIGSTAVLNAGPAAGYVFDGWYYLGQLANKDALYTLTNLQVGYDLVANFVPESQVKKTTVKTPSTKKTTTKKTDTKEEVKKEDQIPEDSALKALDMTKEQAQEKIKSGAGMELLSKAYDKGNFKVSVENQVGPESGNGYLQSSTVKNLADIAGGFFTEEEQMKALLGEQVEAGISIENIDYSISADEKKAIDEYKGDDLQIALYMDINIWKEIAGTREEIPTLGSAARFVLPIPEQFQKDSRSFYIIRKHKELNGSTLMSVLEDEDTDPTTITFSSDKFSTYALAYIEKATEQDAEDTPAPVAQESGSGQGTSFASGDMGAYILIGIIAAMACLTVITVALIVVKSKK